MDDAEVLLDVAGKGVMESLEAYSSASLGPEGLHELVLVCEDLGPPFVLTQVLRVAVQEEPRLKGSFLGLALLRGARWALSLLLNTMSPGVVLAREDHAASKGLSDKLTRTLLSFKH